MGSNVEDAKPLTTLWVIEFVVHIFCWKYAKVYLYLDKMKKKKKKKF